MIINADALARVYTAFSAVFNNAFQATETWYEQVAMTVPSNTRIMDYKFLLDFPTVREWIGDRQINPLEPKAYQVESKDWEATIEIERNDVEDEQLGLYNPIIAAMAEEAKRHPEKLMAELLKNGSSSLCFDGASFFATNHPVGNQSASNFDTSDPPSEAWYLIDRSRAIKPFIFQLRRGVQLVRMDRPDDEHVFIRRKFRYGVDYRGAAAYGLWQLAYCSNQELNATNYAAARAVMMTQTNAEGVPLGIKPTLLIVPPALEARAREILHAQFIIGDSSAGGSKSNIWQGSADLLVLPELA
jgi:phage major head subunit gpT-like protein